MTARQYHLQPLPSGVRIYADREAVAGLSYRLRAALRFARGREQHLTLQAEPANQHDANAVQVWGHWKGWWLRHSAMLGYVPRETARVIAEGGFLTDLKPRLLKTYIGENGFVEVLFQLIGPAPRAQEFKAAFATEDHYTGAVERVKYLKSEARFDEAIQLLRKLVDEVEAEAVREGYGVAPWYYEQLAIIFRKLRRDSDEVSILERYMSQPHAPGVGPAKLKERLERARERASSKS
ncbi:hypothetical protein BH23GEM9_BH23GEM9_16050 [soil metagenome]